MLPDMNYEQKKKFWNFVYMDDFEFFYKFIADQRKYYAQMQQRKGSGFYNRTPAFSFG